MPRVTAWKILEGQVMTVTLEHRRLTYTGALTLQPFGCARTARPHSSAIMPKALHYIRTPPPCLQSARCHSCACLCCLRVCAITKLYASMHGIRSACQWLCSLPVPVLSDGVHVFCLRCYEPSSCPCLISGFC